MMLVWQRVGPGRYQSRDKVYSIERADGRFGRGTDWEVWRMQGIRHVEHLNTATSLAEAQQWVADMLARAV